MTANEQGDLDERGQWRFGLKTLLISVALVALALSTIRFGTTYIMEARQRHSAASWFKFALFAEVIYGQEEPSGFFKWLRENTGGDYFTSVETIRITTPDVDDSMFDANRGFVKNLKLLPDLKRIELKGTRATDSGVKRLRELLPQVEIER